MDFNLAIDTIENSSDYKNFIKTEPEYYLVHVFTTVDSDNFDDDTWQIGYYSKETDKIVVFENTNDAITVHPPAEALKKEEYIQKLHLDELKISKKEATDICTATLLEYYPRELFSKAICLLQNLPEFGNVWNITVVTLAMSVINIKIDAITGKVIKHDKQNLMNWNSK